ncbi:MAG: DUF1080 domain-containing protein [Verrucomicrobia bacterium]|nr:DUF1080 domain-containing protein [Verrucomicrobiota bacterium]
MKTMIRILRSVLLGGFVLAQTSFLAAADQDGPWEPLFNGKDLAGWVPVHDVKFEVKEGHLQLVRGMGWLRTEKEYGDFVLELEWRALVNQYDSGVFIRSGKDGKPWPDGGWQVNLRYDRLCGLVKGYKAIVPSETEKKPLNQWVKLRLEVKGKKVTCFVEGEKAWEYSELDRDKGFIGFQAEEKAFDFRNIRVRELK